MWNRLKLFLNPFDARWEDMNRANWPFVVVRDASAGLVVAMMAIPMAMGFAMASGLRPEHGILAGAIAGLFGALFAGSKYNVYGPVAALIPVIAGIMNRYATPEDPFAGHGYLVLICAMSGPILILFALIGWGKVGNLVPHSVVVGFSVGIAVTIALTQVGEVLGLPREVKGSFLEKLRIIGDHYREANGSALVIAGLTFVMIHSLLKASLFIPAPLLALGVSTWLAATALKESNLVLVKTKYGDIPTDFLQLTPPQLPPGLDAAMIGELAFYAAAFAFVCGFESILAARMGDRLANNKGTKYNPDKEFWGQGLVQSFVPMLNGMPLSGALARTATNIKLGAITPLAGIMKCFLKLLLAYSLADQLEMVPMACIGGILLWVACNMIKPKEMAEIRSESTFHFFLMIYAAVVVVVAGFLPGVLSALAIYGVAYFFFDRSVAEPGLVEEAH